MREKYGVKGPVRRIEQRRFLDLGLPDLPDYERFDVEFSPSGRTLRLTRYNMAGNAIDSEQLLYDRSDEVCRIAKFDGCGKPARSIDLARRIDGNRITTVAESDGKFDGRTVEIFDGTLLLSFASYDENDHLKIEETFQYSGGKLQTSESRYYIPDATLIEKWRSSYDSKGRIAKTYGLRADGTPLGDGKYKYEYDLEGRESRIWTLDEFDPNEQPISITIYEYESDVSGNWIERRNFHQGRSDTKWFMQKRSESSSTALPNDCDSVSRKKGAAIRQRPLIEALRYLPFLGAFSSFLPFFFMRSPC
jgi:hypothetical protein